MAETIGDILPLAVGIAVSPIPIIAVILMLLSPKARSTSLGFLAGWVLGIAVAVTAFTLLSAVLPQGGGDDPKPITAVMQLLLGAGLLVLALRQWRSRPAPGEEPSLPKWMAGIDAMTPGRAFGLAFLLAAVNPKNLLLAAGAGVAVGSAGLEAGEVVIVLIVFTVIAAASVAVPVIAYLAAAERMAAPLERLRRWLVHNTATVMAVLLLVIGVVLIGKGLGNF